MTASPRCRHCGKPIKPSYSEFDYGWTHEDQMLGSWCRTTMAQPEEAAR